MLDNEPVLSCDRCTFHYSGRRPGTLCGDQSWVPNNWLPAIELVSGRSTAGTWRSLGCRGRVWPDDSPQLRKRWSREELRAWQNAQRDRLNARSAEVRAEQEAAAAARAERRKARPHSMARP